MDVSVIIINYNTPDLTQNCINSIFKYTNGIDFEIIVVDNASSDNSIEILSKDKKIILIKNKTNLGFGKANNIGYKYATGKYIALLNSDTIILNNVLKIFYDFAQTSDEKIACMGCLLLNQNKQIVHSFNEFASMKTIAKAIIQIYLYYLKVKMFKDYESVKLQSALPFFVDYITGAALFIRRSVIEKLGFFDTDFFMYFEESELQQRYNKAGYLSVIIDGPLIIHLEGASYKRDHSRSLSQRVMFTKSMFMYMRKKYSYCGYKVFRLIYLLIIPSIIFSGFSYKEKMILLRQIILE